MKLIYYFITSFVLWFFSFRNVLAQDKANSPATQFVITYSNEFIFGLCVIILILTSWLSVKLPTDEKVKPELSMQAKIISALIGGILAFIYSLYRDQALTLLNPVFIFVATLTFPVTILTLRGKFKSYTESIDLTRNRQNKGD